MRSAGDTIRVLSIIHSATYGGPHNQMYYLHRELAKSEEASLAVLLPEEAGDAAERLRATGVPVRVRRLLRPRADRRQQSLVGLILRYPSQVWSLWKMIRADNVDVVEVHGLMNVDGALAARLAGRGVVWQLVDTRPPPWIRAMLMPVVSSLSDVIMTTGQAVADAYPGADSRPERFLTFVPPVSPPVAGSSAERWRVRAALGVAQDALLIVSVGNLNPQKGHGALIDAVAACRNAGRSVELRIRGAIPVGHEVYSASLCSQAVERGFSTETVDCFESGMTPHDLFACADIFCLAAEPRSEGLPTVVLEAMAHGLPIIVTDVGAIREIVEDGRSGLIVPPDDVPALGIAIKTLVLEPALREHIGTNARQSALSMGSVAKFVRVQVEAYQMASDRRRRGSSKGRVG